MGLKAILDEAQFGELDESAKIFYEERDGKFILAIDAAEEHPLIQSLSKRYNEERKGRVRELDKVKEFERRFGPLVDIDDLDLSDVDAERFSSLLPYIKGEQEIPTGGGKGGEGIDLEKIKTNARRPVERERDELKARAEKAESQLQSLVIDNALTQAVAEIKVASPYQKAVRAMFRDKVKVTEGDEGGLVALVEGEYGEQPVMAYLKEWSQTDEGKAFVAAPDNGGGGARGNGGTGGKVKNPWSPEHWNMTEQARVYREDPERAKRMAAEHGKKVL